MYSEVDHEFKLYFLEVQVRIFVCLFVSPHNHGAGFKRRRVNHIFSFPQGNEMNMIHVISVTHQFSALSLNGKPREADKFTDKIVAMIRQHTNKKLHQ